MQAEDRLEQLRAARTDQAEESDDLAARDGQARCRESVAIARGR